MILQRTPLVLESEWSEDGRERYFGGPTERRPDWAGHNARKLAFRQDPAYHQQFMRHRGEMQQAREIRRDYGMDPYSGIGGKDMVRHTMPKPSERVLSVDKTVKRVDRRSRLKRLGKDPSERRLLQKDQVRTLGAISKLKKIKK